MLRLCNSDTVKRLIGCSDDEWNLLKNMKTSPAQSKILGDACIALGILRGNTAPDDIETALKCVLPRGTPYPPTGKTGTVTLILGVLLTTSKGRAQQCVRVIDEKSTYRSHNATSANCTYSRPAPELPVAIRPRCPMPLPRAHTVKPQATARVAQYPVKTRVRYVASWRPADGPEGVG